MPISQLGALNSTALVVPDLYVQIVPPAPVLNGTPSDIAGIVGSASWGPKNTATIIGSVSQYQATFGPINLRKHDLGTPIYTAALQGAANFRAVRVTDGTDVAATAALSGLLFTAMYTGTLGNLLVVTIAPASNLPSTGFKITISLPGYASEVFDNVVQGTAANMRAAVAAAVIGGTGLVKVPSKLVVASVTAAGTVTTGTATLTGGLDGGDSVVGTNLVGSDTAPRTGMYALRNQGCAIAMLSDCDESATWSVQLAFGLSESVYMMGCTPAGDTISNAVTTLQTAGAAGYDFKLMLGDWIYWNDPTNKVQRLVSPQGFVTGLLANLSPAQSSLNKQMYGIVSTQEVGTGGVAQASYAEADLAALISGGLDVITTPIPAGNLFGCRGGHNTATDASVWGDNYPRMTNYLANTFNNGMGQFVGQVITPTLMKQVKATLSAFLSTLVGQNILSLQSDGSLPYSVVCDASNNPPVRTALGYLQADVNVLYSPIAEKFIINLAGGQGVTIQHQPAG